jgi:hypothetical protein
MKIFANHTPNKGLILSTLYQELKGSNSKKVNHPLKMGKRLE